MQNNALQGGLVPIPELSIFERRAEILSGTEASGQNAASRQREDLFHTLIVTAFEGRAEPDIAWSLRRTEAWIIVSQGTMELPAQGWKLHVSAGLSSAEAVLRAVLPVLCGARVSFKVASTLRQLRALNHGFAGNSQVGKFVTVYPVDAAQAVQLAVALDKATDGLRGPAVPSDRSLRVGSRVSYRYGSYRKRLMYTSAGKIASALTTPTGELVVDLRQREKSVPDWLEDPFLAAGVTGCQEKPPNLLIGGRYLQLATLYESPRGGTAMGVDIRQARPCVLKYARQDAYLDFAGKDARDVLRYEASILASLAPDTSFPELFDLVEEHDALYMIMEELRGETLGAYVERTFAEGYLPVEQTVQWGRELARVLGKLHARGLVYRDLKPANIFITSEQKVRLIDFELVLTQGYQHARSDIGTRGFMSPQHRAGGPASVADDIYSLGALLFYLVTRADPIQAPDPSNLLQRPLKLLNPALDERFVELITTCLEPDPARRFSSMEKVEQALGALDGKLLCRQPAPGQEPLPEAQALTPARALVLAGQLGETLCQTVVHQPAQPGVTWLSMLQFSEGVPLRSIHTGVAGTLLALAELVTVTDAPSLRATLQEGVQWLLHSDELIARPVPGLYTGEAGVGTALLRAAQIHREPRWLDAACEKGRWVARQPYTCQDIMSGAAGRLRFHLLLWDETHEMEHLQAALDAGNWLSAVSEDAGDGALCWKLPADFTGMPYVGYAHGAAGIADALLDLFEATQDERFLVPVTGAYRLLERLAVPVLQDRSGLNWPLYVFDQKHEMAGVYWCHGSSGIGTFLLHASGFECMPRALDLAQRAAWTVARGSRWTGPTQCHGLAGNIEFLLDMFQATGLCVYHAEARALAFLLETFASTQDERLVWVSDVPSCVSPDYLLGYAGVLSCLLRLANPAQQPRQLSRRGFRYKPVL